MSLFLSASKLMPWRRMLQAVRASLSAGAMAALLPGMRVTAAASQLPKLKFGQRWGRIMMNQQHPQIPTAPFGDPAEDRSFARAELLGHQAHPGCEVAPAVKSLALADGRDHRR